MTKNEPGLRQIPIRMYYFSGNLTPSTRVLKTTMARFSVVVFVLKRTCPLARRSHNGGMKNKRIYRLEQTYCHPADAYIYVKSYRQTGCPLCWNSVAAAIIPS